MDIQKETRAYESLMRLMKAAEDCRSLFNEARMEYPPPLKRLLGMGAESVGGNRRQPAMIIPPPSSPSRPTSVPPDWIAVPLEHMTPTGIVRGVLVAAGSAVPVKKLVSEVERVSARRVNPGSIANIGTRLSEAGALDRSDDGWRLIDAAKGPLLHGEFAWGPVEGFLKEEVAAWRRQAILHILEIMPSGLQQSQILGHLVACDWLRTPANKDQVKMDMLELQRERKVKRVSRGKWVLTKEDSR